VKRDIGLPIALLLAVGIVAGCVLPATWPTATTPPGVPTMAASGPSPSPAMQAAPTLSTVAGLRARRVSDLPTIDGQLDAVWATAQPLRLTLRKRGTDGERTSDTMNMELRAVHDQEAIYFAAQWTGGAPSGDEGVIGNKLTVHWRIPETEAARRRLDCNVVCHTAFADDRGRLAYANAETIPSGGSETLSAAGGWQAGIWTIEWGRPLLSANPYDLQFQDLERSYLFFVKLFGEGAGHPDFVSDRNHLVFQP